MRTTKRKYLTAAVLCTVLAMNGSVLAASQQATDTVKTSNDVNSPYDSIAVSSATGPAIGIEPTAGAALTVYVTGDKVLQISGAKSSDTYVYDQGGAYGILSADNSGNSVTVQGALSGTVTADPAAEKTSSSSADARSVAIGYANGIVMAQGKEITTGAIPSLTVTATGNTTRAGTSETTGAVTDSSINQALASAESNSFAHGIMVSQGKADTGEIGELQVKADAGAASGGTATITPTTGTVTNAAAMAAARSLSYAYGIYTRNESNPATSISTGKISTLTVTARGDTATGGTATAGKADNTGTNYSAYAGADALAAAYANAYGLKNESGTMATGTIASMTVTATGGTATGGTATGGTATGQSVDGMAPSAPAYARAETFAEARGVTQFGQGTELTIENINSLKVTATAGTATGGQATAGTVNGQADYAYAQADASAEAAGFSNSRTLTVGDLLGVEITAQGGAATAGKVNGVAGNDGSAAYAYAYGIDNMGTLNVTGNVEMQNISATGGTVTIAGTTNPDIAQAYSVSTWSSGGVTNIGVDLSTNVRTTSNGKTVKLVGDVVAYQGGTNNIIFAGDSSLQGNILDQRPGTDYEGTGTNNITFTNSSSWQPVYDNRYGSFSIPGQPATYDPQIRVQDQEVTANLTLNDAANIDLTWDNGDTPRDPATEKRTLTLSSLKGNDGVLIVNTNLAKGTADEFIIKDNQATGLAIDVSYDPALTAGNLVKGSVVSGKARVLTIQNGTLPEVEGSSDSYGAYDYTVTVAANGDGTYSVTGLNITNVNQGPGGGKQTLTSPSKPMREARHDRMALHNLWVNGELNNLEKRLGDLRAVKPAASGIWARYEHNKLEKGSDASLKYNYFQLGFDKDFQGQSGTFYRGAAFSYAKGTGDYENATGDLKEGTLSLYQTWVGRDGRYYDVILKGGKLMSSYDLHDQVNPGSADYHSWAYSLSGEVGKRFTKANGFFLEPQAEFILSRINGADYTTSQDLDVSVDGQNAAILRLGIGAGRETRRGSYYAKASYYHDFGGGVELTATSNTTNPFSYGEDSAKNWAVFTLGGTLQAGKRCSLYGELSKFAGQLTNDVQVNVGARWSF